MARILTLAALLAIGLSLTACAKYESAGWVDNNCSGNSGIHSDEYCNDYTHHARQP
jgi:hypothetical protein